MTDNQTCLVCSSVRVRQGCDSWHYECEDCGYESSTLKPMINDSTTNTLLDEDTRLRALKMLRKANFQTLHAVLRSLSPRGSRLLDVGAAHGWFLDEVKEHFQTTALEPDIQFEGLLKASGHIATIGFFPDALKRDAKYDAITFNDVLEHIPDTNAVLQACRHHLDDSGLLIINCPTSTGAIYRISKLLQKCGINSFFERMWQKGLPSPHLHYFNVKNLESLTSNNGFEIIHAGRLESISWDRLWDRISYAGNTPLLARWLVWLGITVLLPILRLLPADIVYCVARRRA
jgi:2-polyprenyl-3-methyl-5-hydroxy-6-metoxy-1,4-benzoquinol methylase